MSVWMGRKTLYCGTFALAFPLLLSCAAALIKNRSVRKKLLIAVFAAYICGMVYLTLAGRTSEQRLINLTPFWTYTATRDPQYRWQGYMNVFLFIPFGFMLPWTAKRKFLPSLLIGFAFSVCIEAVQYLFALGMCEFDDVFHNTLGTALGYGYWKGLRWVAARCGQSVWNALERIKECICRISSQGLACLANKWNRGRK